MHYGIYSVYKGYKKIWGITIMFFIKSTDRGLREGWTRATFILRSGYLEKVKALACWNRKQVKEVIDEALGSYLKGKKIKPRRNKLLKTSSLIFSALILFLSGLPSANGELKDTNGIRVPILLYHRFGPEVADSMTITTKAFESQMKNLKENGYTVIRLRQLVDYYLGKSQSLPSHSLVITVDDGHKSVYTDFFPLIIKYQIPATLFLYPSALSNAPYAMTWDQLREIKETGLLDFQSHTFWHPNFKNEKKRLNPDAYENFVELQLKRSKEKIERELHVKVDMLAWPFGIYDEELIKKAMGSGYVAAFSMDRRHASISDNPMTFPRYLIGNTLRLEALGNPIRKGKEIVGFYHGINRHTGNF
jgi:peptidoglycan/xylan/chitin deacetylase (PgdA/CDA1 family)